VYVSVSLNRREYTTRMAHLKITNASQSPIHKYENLKRKLYNCNGKIYFNQHDNLNLKPTDAYTTYIVQFPLIKDTYDLMMA
jgi:hypothetical protein